MTRATVVGKANTMHCNPFILEHGFALGSAEKKIVIDISRLGQIVTFFDLVLHFTSWRKVRKWMIHASSKHLQNFKYP